jgi:tripartite-type tricarboxylate transporter receptor subunit TctC
MSKSAHRKSRAGTPPIVSKSRQTRRRRIETAAVLHGHSFRVNATELRRRQFLQVTAGAAAVPAVSRIARAQTFPTKPLHWIVGFPAGGAVDILARTIGQWLFERLGQQSVIENRTGAGSNIATDAVVRAPPDGYTLLLATSTNAINATLYDNLPFNFVRDIAPVASIMRQPLALVVSPSFPAQTVPELIAHARANPGKINMASGGNGTTGHVLGELFKRMAGVNMVHVPYRGNPPALTDLIGGQVQVMFDNVSNSIGYVRAGKLRPLAVTTATRWEGYPEVPTIADFVAGFEGSSWFGVGAPKNTPSEVINKLNREINAALADPKMKARITDLGGTALALSPAEFGKFIVDETDKWGRVIRAANIKAE